MRLEVHDLTEVWTPRHYVPLLKRGRSKVFVEYAIVHVNGYGGGGELIGFRFDSRVAGLCSARYFREQIRRRVYDKIVSTARRGIA